MANPDAMPSTTEIATAMEAPHHVREAVFSHLTGAGLIPDRALLHMVDVRGVRVVNGVVSIPPNFAADLRTRKPYLFAEQRAEFDARRASSAEVDKRLAEINRGFHARAAAAETARVMSGLRGA